MKYSSRGFSLFEVIIAVWIVGITVVIAANKFTSSSSTEKRLTNRVALIDMKQQITSFMNCNETLKDHLSTSSIPLSCDGRTYPVKTKKGKTLTLKSKNLQAVAKCKTNPLTNETGLVVGLSQLKVTRDAETKRNLAEVKKRGRLVKDDLFDGNAFFCGRYFEPIENEWKMAGMYTVNTYEGVGGADEACNKLEIDKRCNNLFGGTCQAKCQAKVGECRSICEGRYPPKPYPCNCSTDSNGNTSCSTCWDYSERNACYGRCNTAANQCKSQNCSTKLTECKAAYGKCKAAEKRCRHKNPVTGDCTCPSVGGPIEEVKEQITWSMSNKACDYGYYGDSSRFPDMAGDICNWSGQGPRCFNFKVVSMDPDQGWNKNAHAGCFCEDDNGVCPEKAYIGDGPERRKLTCNKGAMLPGPSSKWMGCGITTVSCLVKFKAPELKD